MTTEDETLMPVGYDAFLRDLKTRIQTAQIKAALAVNRELVLLYWQIGRDIPAAGRGLGRESGRAPSARSSERLP